MEGKVTKAIQEALSIHEEIPVGTRPSLTERELEILPIIAAGMTSKEIAAKLFLTQQTIKWYRMRLLDKFKAKNTADLLTKGKEAGML